MKNSRPRKVANAAEAQRILKQNGYIGEPNEGRTPDGYEIQNKAEIRKRAGYRVERVYGKNGKVDIYVYDKGVKKPICHLTYTSKSKATASIKTERKAETAKSQKVRVGTCTPYKLSISEGQFKKIVSGGKTVKIRGDRPFFIGRGPNAKGKDKYWFAWFRKGKTMFFPIDDGQAKELVGMAKPAGETREFKTPGWQQLASTKKKPAK